MNADDIATTLRARAVFDTSVGHLDADTLRDLRRSRLLALQASARPVRSRWIWPAGLATAAALALAVLLPTLPHAPVTADGRTASRQQVTSPAPHAVIEPPVAVNAADFTDTAALETADPDMLSDLDFFGWLATEPGDENDPGG